MSESPLYTPLSETLFLQCQDMEAALEHWCRRFNETFMEKTEIAAQLHMTRKELADRDDVIGFLESETERLADEVVEARNDAHERLADYEAARAEADQLHDDKYEMSRLIEGLQGQLELQGNDDIE